MATKTLFELSQDMIDLEIALDEAEDEQSRNILLDAHLHTEQDVKVKLDGYASLIKELQARAEARKAEAVRIQVLSKTDANKASDLLDRLKAFFEERDLPKIETAHYSLNLVLNGGKVPLILSVPVEELPEQFRRTVQVIEPDNDAIRQAIEAGEEVPGAYLAERGKRINIR